MAPTVPRGGGGCAVASGPVPLSSRRPAPAWALIGLALTILLGGCREGTVSLAFRPDPGQRYTYRISVRATTVTTVADEPPRRTSTETVFVSSQKVLAVTPVGGRVEVRVQEKGSPAQTFVVALDRAAQLAEVQNIEGLPARALGDLGLSEIFPAAAAAPPNRPLAPGEGWDIDTAVKLTDAPPARLRGSGRLVSLGRIDGVDVARVESRYGLPVRQAAAPTDNGLTLDGSQTTTARVTYSIDDGAVLSAKARTTGTFDITLFPPPGTPGSPAPGTLTVVVSSTTERLDSP